MNQSPLEIALSAFETLLSKSRGHAENQRLHTAPFLLSKPNEREKITSLMVGEIPLRQEGRLKEMTVVFSFSNHTGYEAEKPATCRFWFHADHQDVNEYLQTIKQFVTASGFTPEDEGFPMTLDEYLKHDELELSDFYFMKDRIRYVNIQEQDFDFIPRSRHESEIPATD